MSPQTMEEELILIYNTLGVDFNNSELLFKKLDDYIRVSTLRPIEEYHEDMAECLFWKVPIEELPYVGCPLDFEFQHDYYTHFSELPRAITWTKL